MKIYKKTLKAFGGAALYLDKSILKALSIQAGDEVYIEVKEGEIVVRKPSIDASKIKELLDNSRIKK